MESVFYIFNNHFHTLARTNDSHIYFLFFVFSGAPFGPPPGFPLWVGRCFGDGVSPLAWGPPGSLWARGAIWDGGSPLTPLWGCSGISGFFGRTGVPWGSFGGPCRFCGDAFGMFAGCFGAAWGDVLGMFGELFLVLS